MFLLKSILLKMIRVRLVETLFIEQIFDSCRVLLVFFKIYVLRDI